MKRSDIIDGKLAETARNGVIYTCHGGWIDLGHARPDGASRLWREVANEDGKRSKDKKGFKVHYGQPMTKLGITIWVSSDFYVGYGLNPRVKQSVALTIFMHVSRAFEKRQDSLPYRKFTDSGFSIEDLVSNILGFYRAVKPRADYFKALDPVSKQAALRIWDTHNPTQFKNKRFGPYLFPCAECKGGPSGPMWTPLPKVLDSIKPAKLWTKTFRPWIPWEDE